MTALAQAEEVPQAPEAKRRKEFAALLVVSLLSLIGSRMTMVALPWLVLETTGSATRTGMVAAAELLPYVLVCALGSPLIDRIGGRRVSVVADLASVPVVAAIPLLHNSGRLGFAGLLGLVAVAGVQRGFGDMAKRGAMFPQVVARAQIEMTRAASLVDGMVRAAGLTGTMLAGALVVLFGGAADLLLIDAASFLVCALLIWGLVKVPGKSALEEKEPYGRALLAGAGHVVRDRLLLGLVVMLFVTNMMDQGYGAVLVPLWAKEIFGSAMGIGVVGASFGIGAVLGNIVFTVLAPRLPRWATYTFGFLIAGAPRFALLAFDAPLWLLVLNGLAAGFAIAGVNPILTAVLYERVPERLQARVMGVSTALSYAGMPLGALLCGWLGDFGVRFGLIVAGGFYLLATLMPFVGKVWREMDLRSLTPNFAAK